MQKFVRQLHSDPWSLFERSMKMCKALLEDRYVDEAMELCNTIQETDIEPMVLIHTSVIEAYLKCGKTKGALEAYLAMFAAGVSPNSYTYIV